MISVSPSIQDETIGIRLDVSARSLNDIVDLINAFQNSPNFDDVVFRSEQDQEDGQLRSSVSLDYFPGGIRPPLLKSPHTVTSPTPSPVVEHPASDEKSLRKEVLE